MCGSPSCSAQRRSRDIDQLDLDLQRGTDPSLSSRSLYCRHDYGLIITFGLSLGCPHLNLFCGEAVLGTVSAYLNVPPCQLWKYFSFCEMSHVCPLYSTAMFYSQTCQHHDPWLCWACVSGEDCGRRLNVSYRTTLFCSSLAGHRNKGMDPRAFWLSLLCLLVLFLSEGNSF